MATGMKFKCIKNYTNMNSIYWNKLPGQGYMNKLIISSIVIYIILKQSRIVVGAHFFNLKLKTQKNWRKTLFIRIGG